MSITVERGEGVASFAIDFDLTLSASAGIYGSAQVAHVCAFQDHAAGSPQNPVFVNFRSQKSCHVYDAF
jgi:hypothetical protein